MSEEKYKYPRTYHLPESLGATSDDKTLKNHDIFYTNGEANEVVITKKMDGENTSLYPNYYHARSIDGRDHPSRHWVKSFHASIRFIIPENYRLCGENMFAKHSIEYANLESYFLAFSLWNKEICLSWDDLESFCQTNDIKTVPVLYRGKFSKEKLEELINNLDLEKDEGLVVRNAHSFKLEDFSKNLAKYVRENHVQTDTHWMNQKVIPNKVKK